MIKIAYFIFAIFKVYFSNIKLFLLFFKECYDKDKKEQIKEKVPAEDYKYMKESLELKNREFM